LKTLATPRFRRRAEIGGGELMNIGWEYLKIIIPRASGMHWAEDVGTSYIHGTFLRGIEHVDSIAIFGISSIPIFRIA
jgi:hypothetical protein